MWVTCYPKLTISGQTVGLLLWREISYYSHLLPQKSKIYPGSLSPMSSSAQWLARDCNVALHHANSISFLSPDQWPAACSRRPPQPAQQLQWSWPAAPYHWQLGAGHLQPHGAPACHGDPEETREKGKPPSTVFLLGKLPPQLSFINFNLDECSAKRWEPPGGYSCFALIFSCQWRWLFIVVWQSREAVHDNSCS